jgi:hypothetical protein
VDYVDSSGGGSLDGTRPQGCNSADGDKYKVTDDGDMKARAIWRENPRASGQNRNRFIPRKNTLLFGLCVF